MILRSCKEWWSLFHKSIPGSHNLESANDHPVAKSLHFYRQFCLHLLPNVVQTQFQSFHSIHLQFNQCHKRVPRYIRPTWVRPDPSTASFGWRVRVWLRILARPGGVLCFNFRHGLLLGNHSASWQLRINSCSFRSQRTDFENFTWVFPNMIKNIRKRLNFS